MKRRQEGVRVKYQMNGNSAKFYDKAYSCWGNVLRAGETTINTVQGLLSYRAKEGGPPEGLQWRGMRKGIADLHRRAEVSQNANERLLNALASVDDSRSVEELTAQIQTHPHGGGRRVRGLRPWGEDKELLSAEAESPKERRRRSAAVSRKLRLLRAHGLIHKVYRTHRYNVAAAGRAILVAVLTTARTTCPAVESAWQCRMREIVAPGGLPTNSCSSSSTAPAT
jgi:hypothetical protein